MDRYIGILGGLGYKATLLVYERLNKLYHLQKGDYHTCPIKLLSIDFNDINMLLPNQMAEAATKLKPFLQEIDQYDVVANIMLNNTLHEAFDLLKPNFELEKPFGHIGQLLQKEINKRKEKQVVLIGTKYTMNQGYFHSYIEPSAKVILPSEALQEKIEKLRKIYYDSQDIVLVDACFQALNKMEADLIIIACTELSIAFESFKNERWIDTIDLQCEFAISKL